MIIIGFLISASILTILFQAIFYICKFLLILVIPEETIFTQVTYIFGTELLVWPIALHIITVLLMLLLKINIEINPYRYEFKSIFINMELKS